MNEKDKEFLKKQEENARKQILDLSIKFAQENGRNINDNWYRLVDTPNGPAFGVVGDIDPKKMKLPDGWKYEINSRREGLVRVVDGKEEFVPIKHIEDKSKVIEYGDINDVRSSLLASNTYITPEQVQIDPQSGGLKLISVRPGEIKIPQGLKMDNGAFVDSYGRRFEGSEESAHASYNNVIAGSEASRTDNIKMSHLQEDAESVYEKKEVFLDSSHIKLMGSLEDLQMAYQKCSKNKKGELSEKTEDGAYKSFEGDLVTDPNLIVQYEIAEAWMQAYCSATGAKGNDGMEGAITNSAVEYKACMGVVNAFRGMSLSMITTALFDLYDFENSRMVEVVLHFISNPKIARMFDIQLDISPEQAIALRETLKNRTLSDEFKSMVSPIKDKLKDLGIVQAREDENDDEKAPVRVMEKVINFNGTNGSPF